MKESKKKKNVDNSKANNSINTKKEISKKANNPSLPQNIVKNIVEDENKIQSVQHQLIAIGSFLSNKFLIVILPLLIFSLTSIFSSDLPILLKTVTVILHGLAFLWILLYIPSKNRDKTKVRNDNNKTWIPQQVELIITSLTIYIGFPIILYYSDNMIEKIVAFFVLIFHVIFGAIFLYLYKNPYLILNRYWVNFGNSILNVVFFLIIYGGLSHYFSKNTALILFILFTSSIMLSEIYLSKYKVTILQLMLIGTIPPKTLVSSISQYLGEKMNKVEGEKLANEILKNNDIQTVIAVIRKLDYELNESHKNTLIGFLTKYVIPILTFLSVVLGNYFWGLIEPIIQKDTPLLEQKIKEVKQYIDRDTTKNIEKK